ncbi:uncharacterized protein LOC116619017 [Nematostella vectensis]|uniref:uncharacterized protein LOC116619017 n=1 Tax=Nematostella vectensis TaxID=45351 RepID=UPI002076F99C|nr:uncharacterized protein LOC116619017 [Nematostella vectensis]
MKLVRLSIPAFLVILYPSHILCHQKGIIPSNDNQAIQTLNNTQDVNTKMKIENGNHSTTPIRRKTEKDLLTNPCYKSGSQSIDPQTGRQSVECLRTSITGCKVAIHTQGFAKCMPVREVYSDGSVLTSDCMCVS